MAQSVKNAMDLEYQAESDARTLAEAEEIKQDRKRLKRAVVKAKKMAKDAEKQAGNYRKVTKKKVSQVTNQRKKVRKKRG